MSTKSYLLLLSTLDVNIFLLATLLSQGMKLMHALLAPVVLKEKIWVCIPNNDIFTNIRPKRSHWRRDDGTIITNNLASFAKLICFREMTERETQWSCHWTLS